MAVCFSMVHHLQTLTDSQRNPSKILEKSNILVFGSVLVGAVLMFCKSESFHVSTKGVHIWNNDSLWYLDDNKISQIAHLILD